MRSPVDRIELSKGPEEWRTIAGFPEYEVSNYGRVISYKGRSPRMIRPEVSKLGYWRFHLYRRGADHPKCAHRLVVEAFIGPSPKGKDFVLHWDGNPQNNHVSNLRWGDARDNFDDAMRHGTVNWPRHESGLNSSERRADASRRHKIAKLEERKLTAIDWLVFSSV